MSIRNLLLTSLTCLLGLVAIAGLAAAQSVGECPECDEDGEPDDSWYNSVDTGVITEEGGVIEDTDVSVGENQHGRFTWFQNCLRFFDAMGNTFAIMFEVFASEDGVDVDATADINGEKVDLEDTLIGDLDDQTWGAMEGVDLPTELVPVDHTDLPEPVDIDECVYLDETPELDVAADLAATCDIALS